MEQTIQAHDLPLTFQVKYLGAIKASGAWGIKFIRKPVDLLVDSTKTNRSSLSIVDVKITLSGLEIHEQNDKSTKNQEELKSITYKVESISYGVQDLQFTRVFAMIISNPEAAKVGGNEYTCHAFACASKQMARQMTHALAAAFKHYADQVASKQQQEKLKHTIDLSVNDDEDSETEA